MKYPNQIEVTITDDDLLKSPGFSHAYDCPLALALQRTYPELMKNNSWVGLFEIWLGWLWGEKTLVAKYKIPTEVWNKQIAEKMIAEAKFGTNTQSVTLVLSREEL